MDEKVEIWETKDGVPILSFPEGTDLSKYVDILPGWHLGLPLEKQNG